MKRSYLILAVGALSLSACTSESVLEDAAKSRNVIGFENVVNKLSRVDDIVSGEFKKFAVYGYYTTPESNTVAVPVFENVEVTKQSSGSWTYSGPDRYWVPGAHYYFYAYSCGNAVKLDKTFGEFSMAMGDNLLPENRVLMINNYVCDNSHQHDLIFASNTGAVEGNTYAGIEGKEQDNDDVTLQFKHLLTKIQAKFTSGFPAGYEVIISDVSIQNIHNVGTYNPNAVNGWQNVQHKENAVSPFVYLLDTANGNATSISTTAGGNAALTEAAYVLPYQYPMPEEGNTTDWVFINFDLKVMNKGQVILTKNNMIGRFNPTWLSGFTYTYNIEINGSAADLQVITFTTASGEGGEVLEWTDNTDKNVITIDKD